MSSQKLDRRTRQNALVVTVAIAGLVSSGVANATNGYFASGYDIQSQGMGGVGIALPQTSVASALNPAGIGFVGDRVDLGVTYFQPNRNSQIVGSAPSFNGNYDGNGTKNFWIPNFGITKDLGSSFTVGLAAYGNGGMNTNYKSGIPIFGESNAGVNLEQLFVTPTIAWKPIANQSVGLSLIYARQTFTASGLQHFANSYFSNSANNVYNNGTSVSNGFGGQIGWTGNLTDTISAGLTYRTKISASNFNQYSGLFAGGGSFDIPATYGLGLTWKPTEQWTLSGDVSQIQYSQVNSISNNLPNVLTTPLGGPAGFPQGQLLGQNNGAGFGWKDVTVFKIGGAYKFTPDFTVRAGYNYNTQPIQNSQTLFNTLAPGVIQQQASVGLTYALDKAVELSAFYAHGFYNSVNGSNSIPAPFGGGNANINMYQNSFGFELGWKY